MNYHWNWAIFGEMSPDGVHSYWQTLLSGLGWTVATSLTAWLMALALGLAVGTLRTLPSPWLRRLGTAYVELFRNVPLLVQMFLWFFVMPELLPPAGGDWLKALPNAPFVTAVICLGFFTSAHVGGILLELEQDPRDGSPPASRRCPAASAWPGWRSACRCRRPTATCCCRWRCAWCCRRWPASSSTSSRTVRWR